MESLVRTLEFVSVQITMHRRKTAERPHDEGHRHARGIALAGLLLVSDRLLEEIQHAENDPGDPYNPYGDLRHRIWNAETAINLRGIDEETDTAVEAVMKQHGLNQVKLYGDLQ